jgi:excisionase family DNA binding protein
MQSTQPKEPPAKLLLTVEEAAQILSVGRTLLYDLVMRGKVGSVKIGNARRIPGE